MTTKKIINYEQDAIGIVSQTNLKVCFLDAKYFVAKSKGDGEAIRLGIL